MKGFDYCWFKTSLAINGIWKYQFPYNQTYKLLGCALRSKDNFFWKKCLRVVLHEVGNAKLSKIYAFLYFRDQFVLLGFLSLSISMKLKSAIL